MIHGEWYWNLRQEHRFSHHKRATKPSDSDSLEKPHKVLDAALLQSFKLIIRPTTGPNCFRRRPRMIFIQVSSSVNTHERIWDLRNHGQRSILKYLKKLFLCVITKLFIALITHPHRGPESGKLITDLVGSYSNIRNAKATTCWQNTTNMLEKYFATMLLNKFQLSTT